MTTHEKAFPTETTLDCIGDAPNRYAAAHAIRACSCKWAARLQACSHAARIRLIEEAEKHAEQLERDYSTDGDTLCEPPWRDWLKDWGYF